MSRRAIYKDLIIQMLSEGVTSKIISEKLGCSISAVNNYRQYRLVKSHRPNRDALEGCVWCSRCKKYYPKEMFNRDRNQGNGLQHICKDCNKKMAKRYRERISSPEMKVFIYDYNETKKEINIAKKVKSAFMIVVSGDQILHILYEDNSQEYYSSLSDGYRIMDCLDDYGFVNLFDGRDFKNWKSNEDEADD